jgi:hypothetical protein
MHAIVFLGLKSLLDLYRFGQRATLEAGYDYLIELHDKFMAILSSDNRALCRAGCDRRELYLSMTYGFFRTN